MTMIWKLGPVALKVDAQVKLPSEKYPTNPFMFSVTLVIYFSFQLDMLQWWFVSPLYLLFSYGMLIKLIILNH